MPQNKDQNFISFIIPFRRNEDVTDICAFIRIVDPVFSAHFKAYEFIIVATGSELRHDFLNDINKETNGHLIRVDLAWQHNLENVMSAGIDVAIGDFVFEMDQLPCDYPPELLLQAYQSCLKGYDVVAASPEGSINVSSRVFYRILSLLSFRSDQLTTESFRVISRRAINRVYSTRNFLKYRKAMYHSSGLPSLFVWYKPDKTIRRRDLSVLEKFRLAGDIIIGYSHAGTTLASVLSIIWFIFAVSIGMYALYSYFFHDDIQAGWTTTMLFLSLSFSGLFFILSILSKYLVVILTEMQNKSGYVYKNITRFEK